jgi:hypothetical protein
MADDELRPIRCYVSPAPSKRDQISGWYAKLSPQGRSDADEFIKAMRKKSDWKMPDYRPSLKGHQKLGELRWWSENKQHRLVGYFKDGVFFALIGCTHKQQIYDPPEALDTAGTRKKHIEDGWAETVEYDL